MIRLFRQYTSSRKLFFVLGEGFIIYCSVILATFILMGKETDMADLFHENWARVLVITLGTQLSLYFNDLYEFRKDMNLLELSTFLIQSIGITSIALAVVYFLWPEAVIGRWIFVFSIVFLILFVLPWRLLYAYILQKKVFAEKTIMIGDGELACNILEETGKRKDIAYNIRYVIGDNGSCSNQFTAGPEAELQLGFVDLCRMVEDENISNIIVALDQRRGVMPCRELLDCKVRGVTIIDGQSFFERITGKLLVEKIAPSWIIFSDGFAKSGTARLTKRVMGLILSAVMLVAFSPVIVLVAAAIKVDSKGSVLFTQERVGENEKIFILYKFRSMRADAEKESGPVWAEENDPRVTRVGRIIRKLRIDELPQLWNVFKGDMSFVGPRPERPYFVEQLKEKIPYYSQRFTVKPGITGWAQIRYPYGATEADALEKLKYDLFYIKNMSILMDCLIIFHTFKTVLLGRGSR